MTFSSFVGIKIRPDQKQKLLALAERGNTDQSGILRALIDAAPDPAKDNRAGLRQEISSAIVGK